MEAPGGRPGLARRLAAHVYLDTSPDVALSAADYFELSHTAYQRVHAWIRDLASTRDVLRAALHAAEQDPDDVPAHRALAAELLALLEAAPDLEAQALELVADADAQIWIDYWLGEEHRGSGAVPSYDTSTLNTLPWPSRSESASPRTQVIIPFRDAGLGPRTRNLLACLRTLYDQDDSAGAIRIVVVETDRSPHARDLLPPLVDDYVFAPKAGLFNKSWAVNVGLRHGGLPGVNGTAPITCVLDADILIARDYVATNVERLASDGHEAHLTYRRMFSMDAPSTDLAIHTRLAEGAATAEMSALRGLLLRDTPGGSLWATTEALHRIGGFDERYEGWGGEDDDVIARLSQRAAFTIYDDPLLHLNHPRPPMTKEDGQALNGHLLETHRGDDAWTGADGYGDPRRFAAGVESPE
ncbi:galactosyltransferase-related protein [Catenulispora sp. GP43]|uniref:galactosyltransferase-related protein n=1 Tax=Catenulispora sp. GP43 TaxID=3156263 RepID=UPI00351744E5